MFKPLERHYCYALRGPQSINQSTQSTQSMHCVDLKEVRTLLLLVVVEMMVVVVVVAFI